MAGPRAQADVSVAWSCLRAVYSCVRPRDHRLTALSALCVAACACLYKAFSPHLRLAHKGQKRKSGEPYIVHPVAVAELLAQLKVSQSLRAFSRLAAGASGGHRERIAARTL